MIVPVSVPRMYVDTYEFPLTMVYEVDLTGGSLRLIFQLLDMQNRPITFNTSNPPKLHISFERDEMIEHS